MNDSERRDEPAPGPADANAAKRPYEPPRLTRIGDLRDLLGKTGTQFDVPNPHTRRN